MRFLAVIMAVLLAFTPTVVYAQDSYTRFRLPAGHACVVGGERFQCYNLGEVTEMLHMDEDLHNLVLQHTNDLAQIVTLTAQAHDLQLAQDAALSQVTTLQAERDRLTQQWEQADAALRAAQNAPDWSWVPWTIAAAFAVSTLVLGLVVGLERR